MPPAERSDSYDLPTMLRLPYLAVAGIGIGLIFYYLMAHGIGSEAVRLLAVFVLLSIALLGYHEAARRYKNRYGSVDASHGSAKSSLT